MTREKMKAVTKSRAPRYGYEGAYRGLFVRLPLLYNELFRMACKSAGTTPKKLLLGVMLETIEKELGKSTRDDAEAFVASHYPPGKHREYWESKLIK